MCHHLPVVSGDWFIYHSWFRKSGNTLRISHVVLLRIYFSTWVSYCRCALRYMTKRWANARLNLHHFLVDCFTFVAVCFCRMLQWPRATNVWPNRRSTALVNSMYRFNSDTSYTTSVGIHDSSTRWLVKALSLPTRRRCIVSTRRVGQHEKLCDLIVPLHLILTPPETLTEWQILEVLLLLCPTDRHSWVAALARSHLSYMSLHLSANKLASLSWAFNIISIEYILVLTIP